MKFESGFSATAPDEDRAALHLRYKKMGLIALGLLLAALVIVKLVNYNWEAPAAPMPQTVTVMVPGRQPIDLAISATGTLAARREMPVGIAGEGGMVARVLVEPGDWVKAGQTLATIDRSVQTQQAGQLVAQINAARANAALAEAELVRAQSLKERGFVSRADIDRKTATRDAARAQVRVAQAQLGEINARISRLDIRAPAAGLVLERKIEPGEVVSSGSGMLFRLAKGGEIELLARLAEADLARLQIGNSANVTPVGSTSSFTGKVWQISPVIDPQTRQGVVRIALGYDPQLRPGGFATAALVSGQSSLPIVPESAVQGDAKASYVYVIGHENKAERRPITIGTVSEKGVAITSGINGDEQVVVLAGAFLNPGEKVMPVRMKGKGAGQ